jgi:hypothetical protein
LNADRQQVQSAQPASSAQYTQSSYSLSSRYVEAQDASATSAAAKVSAWSHHCH